MQLFWPGYWALCPDCLGERQCEYIPPAEHFVPQSNAPAAKKSHKGPNEHYFWSLYDRADYDLFLDYCRECTTLRYEMEQAGMPLDPLEFSSWALYKPPEIPSFSALEYDVEHGDLENSGMAQQIPDEEQHEMIHWFDEAPFNLPDAGSSDTMTPDRYERQQAEVEDEYAGMDLTPDDARASNYLMHTGHR
jgi:hypothetical protein